MAQASSVDQLLDRHAAGPEAVHMRHPENALGPSGRVDDCVTLGHRVRHGLLAEHVQAMLEGLLSQRGTNVRRGGQHYGIHSIDQFTDGPGCPRNPELACQTPRPAEVRVHKRDEVHRVDRQCRRHVYGLGDGTAPDDSNLDPSRHHCGLPRAQWDEPVGWVPGIGPSPSCPRRLRQNQQSVPAQPPQ